MKAKTVLQILEIPSRAWNIGSLGLVIVFWWKKWILKFYFLNNFFNKYNLKTLKDCFLEHMTKIKCTKIQGSSPYILWEISKIVNLVFFAPKRSLFQDALNLVILQCMIDYCVQYLSNEPSFINFGSFMTWQWSCKVQW